MERLGCLPRPARIALAVLVVALGGCAKGVETGANEAVAKIAELKADRIIAKAPGTWVCRDGSVKSDGGGTTIAPTGYSGYLTVTIGADGTFAYAKHHPDENKPEYSGNGTWSVENGNLEVRTEYERGNDQGYRVSGVADDATDLVVEDIEYRTNGSRVPKDDEKGKVGVRIVSDDHVDLHFGRGRAWSCRRDADEAPATTGPRVRKTRPTDGEVIATVVSKGSPSKTTRTERGGRPLGFSVWLQGAERNGRYQDTSRADGTFSLEVTPDRYRIESAAANDYSCSADEFEVRANETTRVTITCTWR